MKTKSRNAKPSKGSGPGPSKPSGCATHPKAATLNPAIYAPDGPRTTPVRASKMGRRRAFVLIAVHLAIFAHILHWKLSGSTLSPLEPSEAMHTVATGAINAGAILLLVAIAATFVFGRFFCGWACHLLALQDGANALLRKMGFRPVALKSKLLVWVPLIAAIHLFFWPAILRWFRDEPAPDWSLSLTKTAFWETFPGFWVALITFSVCGFLMIWLLGSKGFCTYACPYGGFFGLADRFSPGRIKVSDACVQCGHCTSVCTSNVLVHKEVHEFGQVVDPGCMKCLDCVSACPEGALSFGFGTPPAFATKRRPFKKALSTVGRFVWRQELALVVIFLFTLVMLRGALAGTYEWAVQLYGAVPQLLALGLAATTAFLAVGAFDLLRRKEARFQGWQLRQGGQLTGKGKIFASLAAAWFLFLGHSTWVQVHTWSLAHAMEQTSMDARAIWAQNPEATHEPSSQLDATLERAEFHLKWARRLGLVHDVRLDRHAAWLALARGDITAARSELQTVADHLPRASNSHFALGRVALMDGDAKQAVSHFLEAKARNTDSGRFGQPIVTALQEEIRVGSRRAAALAAAAIDREEELTPSGRREALTVLGIALKGVDPARAAGVFRQLVEEDPSNLGARSHLAGLLMDLGNLKGAIAELAFIVEARPQDPAPRRLLQQLRAARAASEAERQAPQAPGQ